MSTPSETNNGLTILSRSSSYLKPRYASHAPKFFLLDGPRTDEGPVGLPSDEASSGPVGSSVHGSTHHVYTRTTRPFEPDHPTRCEPAPTRLDGASAARIVGHPHIQGRDESRTHPSEINAKLASVWTQDTRRSALSQDPLVDPAASLGSISSYVLTDALEFVAGVLRSIASGPAPRAHFELLRTILQRFGSDLLRRLDAKASAELLCLLGTVSDDTNAHKFHSYSGEWNINFVSGKYWEEVVMVAEVKESLGHMFGEREIYWSMRAYLEQVRATGFQVAREKSQAYYLRLALTTQSESAVVVPYLDTFLMSPLTPEFGGALHILCDVLKRCSPHQSVIEILWTVILAHGSALSPEQKTTILDTMFLRLSSSKSETIREHATQPLGIEDLVVGFVASFFPCYLEMEPSASLLAWARGCARSSIAEEVPINDRFSNLVLIAAWILPQESPDLPDFRLAAGGYDWRPFIGLAILDQLFRGRRVTAAGVRELRHIARSLWHLWEGAVTVDKPREASWTIMTAFLRAAARLEDKLLLDSCLEHISTGTLWKTTSYTEEPEARHVEQLFGALAECVLVFKGRVSTQMLLLLEDVSHSPFHLNLYLKRIFQQLAISDVELAHQFYCENVAHGIPVSSEASVLVAQALACGHYWDKVIAFLQDDQFDNASLEPLLETILHIFRTNRQEATTPTLAVAVAEALLMCYSNTSIPCRLKYPIRFFLPIMIASRHPLKAVQVLEVLLRNNPIMFSSRYFLRIIRTLFRYRQPALGIRVFRLATEVFNEQPVIINDFSKKTRYGLVRAGAFKLASPPYIGQPYPRTLRDRLVSLSLHKPARSVWRTVLRSLPILTTSPVSGSAVLIAVQVLLRHRRFNLARQLIAQSSSQLKPQDMTTIGNAYLHAPLLYWNKHNGRLMRHVLRTKDFLSQKHGFVADRVTVNIVIKTMLRWRVYIDSRNILCLFDHLIRSGYPASNRWHTANGVPFGTLPGEMALDLSGIRQGFSFKRHVRPLYRMFIRELFLRKNPRAAQKIIGILKEEEVLAREVKEHRDRARRLGVIKKQRALAKARMINRG